jgi:hypothetical protein
LVIQPIISVLDENNYLVMSSVDLTAAFDLVDMELLTKGLYTVGLPRDVMKPNKLGLLGRSFVVSVDGETSIMLDVSSGVI